MKFKTQLFIFENCILNNERELKREELLKFLLVAQTDDSDNREAMNAKLINDNR